MSCTNPANEFEALVHLAERLQRQFPQWEDDALFTVIAEELEVFDGARIRDYIPVLVEHNVRARLKTGVTPAA